MLRRITILLFLLLSGCGIGTMGAMALLGAGVAALSAGGMYYYDHQAAATPTPLATPMPAPTK